jgi:hypothetical protein
LIEGKLIEPEQIAISTTPAMMAGVVLHDSEKGMMLNRLATPCG